VCLHAVPGDLSYLPPASSLRATFQFLAEAKDDKEELSLVTTSLVSAMGGRSLSQWPLPPADYSSLLRPVFGVGVADMGVASVRVLCGARGGQGVSSFLLYLASPTVFLFLPVS